MIPRSFWIYLASRFCSATAMTLLRATVLLHVWDLTRSELHLGLIGVSQFVPALTLTLVGGAVADAYDRRRIMRVAQLPLLATGSTLVWLTFSGAMTEYALFAAVFANSMAFAFDSPARQALLPSLVTMDVFPRAVTYSSLATALAFATGPALAGLVIAGLGVQWAYAAYVVLVAMNLFGLGFVRAVREVADRRAPSLQAVREGLAFVWRNPVVLGCMAIDMFAVVLGGATALLPVYRDLLAVGDRGYGILASSLEIGALAMSGLLVVRGPVRRAGPALLAAVTVYGLATIVFGGLGALAVVAITAWRLPELRRYEVAPGTA